MRRNIPNERQRIERFNPRICKRCDNIEGTSARQTAVSIHASVKDATQNRRLPETGKSVSIHASVKDATSFTDNNLFFILVSIHASVKDATF